MKKFLIELLAITWYTIMCVVGLCAACVRISNQDKERKQQES